MCKTPLKNLGIFRFGCESLERCPKCLKFSHILENKEYFCWTCGIQFKVKKVSK